MQCKILKLNYSIRGSTDFYTSVQSYTLSFDCSLRFDDIGCNALVKVNGRYESGNKDITISFNNASKIFGKDTEKNKILALNIKDKIKSIVLHEIERVLMNIKFIA